MTHLSPGIHRDISDEIYHADTLCDRLSLSSTLARTIIGQSPLHAWTSHPRLNPDWEPTEKKTFDIGRAAHRAVLGRGGDYVEIPERYLASNGAASTKQAKEFIADTREAGLTPLKGIEIAQIEVMAARARMRMAENGLKLDAENSEVTALAEVEGVMCRARIDSAPPTEMRLPGIPHPRKVMIDFKTCESATDEACRRAVENYVYDFPAQFYAETWEAATGEPRDMLFVFQEKSAPFEVKLVHLLNEPGHSSDWFEDARQKTAAARALWGECLRTNRWHGYPNGIVTLGARPFYRQAWQDRAAMISQTSKPAAAALRAAYDAQAPQRMAGE